MLAIVLTFDRLPCTALGCYGNEWIDTPHFDLLAAEGFVFDAHVAQSLSPPTAATIPWVPEPHRWRERLKATNVRTALIRENHAVAAWFDSVLFADWQCVSGRDGTAFSPREWPFARLMGTACERVTQWGESGGHHLLWLHSAGIPLPCEVPPDVELLYVDEFTERGWEWSTLTRGERALHPVAQAGYCACLDYCLGEFLATVREAARHQPVLVAISAMDGGGWQSIQRRSAIPPGWDAATLRTPSIWWSAAPTDQYRTLIPGRSWAIVQPQDLLPTLWEWFGDSDGGNSGGHSLWPIFEGTAERVREAAIIDNRVVWTERDVTMVTEAASGEDGGTPAAYHFLWPEDLWQVNDVAKLVPDIVAERLARLSPPAAR